MFSIRLQNTGLGLFSEINLLVTPNHQHNKWLLNSNLFALDLPTLAFKSTPSAYGKDWSSQGGRQLGISNTNHQSIHTSRPARPSIPWKKQEKNRKSRPTHKNKRQSSVFWLNWQLRFTTINSCIYNSQMRSLVQIKDDKSWIQLRESWAKSLKATLPSCGVEMKFAILTRFFSQ